MKTERRHELQENELAKDIVLWGDKIKPYSNALLGVLGVLLGLYAVWSMWGSFQKRREQQAWDQYESAFMEGNYNQLFQVVSDDQFSGTPMQEWGYLAWADRQLLLANDRYFVDRAAADKMLQAAVGVYDSFVTSSPDPELRNRARLGLARVEEMQNHLDKAAEHYSMVDGAIGELAKRRAKLLESKSVQADADWLAKAEPPKVGKSTGPGVPGQRPGFEAPAPRPDGTNSGPLNSEDAKSLEEIFGGLNDDAPEDASKTAPAAEPAKTAPAESTPPADAPPATK